MSLSNKTKKIYLNVPYSEKDEAKGWGARWDAGRKNGLLKIIIVLKRKQWQDGDVNLILIKLNYFCDNYIFLIITITTKMPNGWKKNAKY